MRLEALEDDFTVTEETAGELIKRFSLSVQEGLDIFCDYYQSFTNMCLTDLEKYSFCVTLEQIDNEKEV
jgi:hypothetical protein